MKSSLLSPLYTFIFLAPDTITAAPQRLQSEVSSAETSGFLIVDHTRRTLTLVFRGSQTPRNSFTSFNCFLIPTPSHCPNCKLHSGFHSAYQHLAPTVHNHLQDLQTLSTRFKTYKLILAGHSLGGALATIAAADLAPRLAPGSLQLYTFGSPRVGNAAFAQHLHSLLGAGNVFRVTHLNDAVPRMPRREWGYAHVGSEFHITSPGFKGALDADREELTEKENLVVREGDVRVLEMPGDAGESEDGVVGYDGGNLGVHHSYFEHVDAASEEGFGAGDFLTFICKFSDDC
ncbi:hypothetical protein MBLNU230_g3944t1 [Neophaeotheca triangularis]